MAASASSNKKSFEYRMCKKVAELTQVVHMLFTRNHEKEVEMEVLKEAYEYEIELVQKDAEGHLGALRKQVDSLQKNGSDQLAAAREGAEAETRAKLTTALAQLEAAQNNLAAEKKESQKLRELLVIAQTDIEALRQGVNSELSSKLSELDAKRKEVESLKEKLQKVTSDGETAQNRLNDRVAALETSLDVSKTEVDQQRSLHVDAVKAKEGAEAKLKQIEAELRRAKKELQKRQSPTNEIKPPSDLDHSEEVERLRREVQRYRMELRNRESNFNRVFTDHNPVHVTDAVKKPSFSREVTRSSESTRSSSRGRMVRENTFSGTGSDRLQVSLDVRQRLESWQQQNGEHASSTRLKVSSQPKRLPPMTSHNGNDVHPRFNQLSKLAKTRSSQGRPS